MTELLEMLKRHEGSKKFAYRCTENKLTIGVGRNIDKDGGIGLSEDEIDYLLENDITRVIQELGAEFPWFSGLDEVRRDVMINICFNLGLPRLKGFKKALGAMENHDYITAGDEFLDSRWSEQVGDRAVELCGMLKTGKYVYLQG